MTKNLKYFRKKYFNRRFFLSTQKSFGILQSKSNHKLILNKSDRKTLNLFNKTRKIKKAHNLKLLTGQSELKEVKKKLLANEDSDFDDDLIIRDEKESQLIHEKNDPLQVGWGPKNDYNQHFVDTGERPQNFIRDAGLAERFEEYPKQKELIKLKDEQVTNTNLPTIPMFIKSPLRTIDNTDYPLNDLIGCEFDVILVEPPLHEYKTSNGVHFDKYFSWDEIKKIDIASITAQRSFIFLWCGSGDGLDKGRECLKKWGFRRCEDICWIKTNKTLPKYNKNIEPGAILQRTKEHCLMGIKGTVRRSVDANFIHTNIDIDLIITEEPRYGKSDKPEEIFHIIEHFCLGKRRLYLFGRDATIRPGWLTVGPDLTETNFNKEVFKKLFDETGNLTGTTERIEMLRPRTPPLKAKLQASLNTIEPITLPNHNVNTISENNNNTALNLNSINNLTYIDSTINETHNSILINNSKETENNDS